MSQKIDEKMDFLLSCKPEDVPYELAYNAHRGTSFVPETRAKQRQQQYLDHMREVHGKLAELADTPEKQTLLGQELARYRRGWLDKYKEFLHAESRVVSSMIAGPSKFPAARMNKRANTADKRLTDLMDFQKRAFVALERKLAPEHGPIKSADADAVQKLQGKLAQLEETQAFNKKINQAHARFLKDPASLDRSELPENTKEMIRSYKPRYSWEPHPVPPYELSNNNAEIRRLRARIDEVSKMQATPHAEMVYSDGISVVENPKAGRIQVHFPAKPDRQTIDLMKRSGFHWSRSEGAWQRHLNNAGRYAVESVMKQLGKEKGEAVPAPTKEEPTTLVDRPAIEAVPIEGKKMTGAVERDATVASEPNPNRSERGETMAQNGQAAGQSFVELTEDEFATRYALVRNHFSRGAIRTYDDGQECLFDTYGPELEFVRQQDPRRVWTLMDGGDGDMCIRSGFHFTNRLGYLVSTAPVPEGVRVAVSIPMQADHAEVQQSNGQENKQDAIPEVISSTAELYQPERETSGPGSEMHGRAQTETDVCRLDLGRFCSKLTATWNQESETHTYAAGILFEGKPAFRTMLKHELAGVLRISDDRGWQWLQEHLREQGFPEPSIKDLQDFQETVRATEALIGRFIDEGHEAVLQDQKLSAELGLEVLEAEPLREEPAPSAERGR
jgi:hypothetical protein